MTKLPDSGRCRWCGHPVALRTGPGRPRVYCRRSCRQRDYEARRRAAELGLGESELVVTRSELEEFRDSAYVLACAIEDVERDLAEAAGIDDYREALAWILEAARPLVQVRLTGSDG